MQTQATAGSQQAKMMTPPTVITVKDLDYLRDAMSWLLLAAKKCAHYAKECTDPQIAQVIGQIGQVHERHYHLLLRHCTNNNTQAMAQVPKQPQNQ